MEVCWLPKCLEYLNKDISMFSLSPQQQHLSSQIKVFVVHSPNFLLLPITVSWTTDYQRDARWWWKKIKLCFGSHPDCPHIVCWPLQCSPSVVNDNAFTVWHQIGRHWSRFHERINLSFKLQMFDWLWFHSLLIIKRNIKTLSFLSESLEIEEVLLSAVLWICPVEEFLLTCKILSISR